jgi:hypothetical protein
LNVSGAMAMKLTFISIDKPEPITTMRSGRC